MRVIRCQDGHLYYRNKYFDIGRPKISEFGTTLITGMNKPLTNYEIEGRF
jgi:hypothetical protein